MGRHGVLTGHREEFRADLRHLLLLARCTVVLGLGEGHHGRHPLVAQKPAEASLPSAAALDVPAA